MGQFIKDMGFQYKRDALTSADQNKNEPYFINDLLPDDPIDFKGSGKLFLFFPFKSYERTPAKGETPIYGPAVATFEYTFSTGKDGYPVFNRKTHFTSLLRSNITLKP